MALKDAVNAIKIETLEQAEDAPVETQASLEQVDGKDIPTVKGETVRVSCAIPAALYEQLFNNDRFDKRKEKGEYLGFIIESYATGLNTPPQV